MKFSQFIPRSRTPGLPPYGEQDPHTFENGYRPSPPPGAITPYLGLRSRLSQVWFNRWTILLLLILARLLISISSLHGNLASAEREALSACTSVESMGSAMASMPHYMSRGVNELTASGVEKAINGLMSMLELTVTGVEEIFVFFVNVMTQTYLCLITLVVSGMMNAAIDVLKKATEFIDDVAGRIGNSINEGVSTIQEALNGFSSLINTIGGDIPKLDLGGPIKELEDLSLPDSLTDDLNKLKEKIPNFEDVNNFTNNALRAPFELVKKLIRDEVDEYKFDRSAFPIPSKEQLRFCDDNDGIHSFFRNLASLIGTAKKIFIGVLVVSAILVCVPMAYREIRSWRSMKERSSLVRSNAHDPMDVVYIVSRPFTSTTGLKVANWFSLSRRQVLVRWIVAYVTSPPALFLLSLGIAGLFSCACQAILLTAVKKEVPALTEHVGKFAEKVVLALNNASEQWAISTNRVIDDTNDDINQKVFGWVNQTTGSVNNTLNVFVDETSKVLNRTFGGTILYEPIKEVLHCLIGLKIEGVQKGLTWVSEHAKVDFPNMSKDTFSLGALESISKDNNTGSESFLSNPGDKTADKISEAVRRVTDSVESGIRTEAIISGVIISIWFFVLLLAIIRALTLWFGHGKTRGDGNGDSEFPHLKWHLEMRRVSVMCLLQLQPMRVQPRRTRPNEPIQGFNPANDGEDYYQEQKLGFAGQRELRRDGGGHSRESSYGEVEYVNDVKR
ncbi:plasma membrane fusion protein PRM1 [Emergomyces africanus]|uniref:Plasma membrane fusion protein PRM1 n=1 Tax=Emergomyces africanus TaxID=1955775 RepID=A0A1B7P6Z9_9EURO|nr:plasma membrane fusion protein PRM1 [Emergomyces africanus]